MDCLQKKGVVVTPLINMLIHILSNQYSIPMLMLWLTQMTSQLPEIYKI